MTAMNTGRRRTTPAPASDSTGGRGRHGDERRGKRGPAGLRGEQRDGERADRHERALSERRHPAERDRQPEPRRREREVEAVRHRVDVHPRRRDCREERGERDEGRGRGVPVRPRGARLAGRLGERAAGAADERRVTRAPRRLPAGGAARRRAGRSPAAAPRGTTAPSWNEPMCAFAIVASATPEDEAGDHRPQRRAEPDDERRDESLQPEQRAGVHVDRAARRRDDRRDRRHPAGSPERDRDEGVDRHADDARALVVRRDRLQGAAESASARASSRRRRRARPRPR